MRLAIGAEGATGAGGLTGAGGETGGAEGGAPGVAGGFSSSASFRAASRFAMSAFTWRMRALKAAMNWSRSLDSGRCFRAARMASSFERSRSIFSALWSRASSSAVKAPLLAGGGLFGTRLAAAWA